MHLYGDIRNHQGRLIYRSKKMKINFTFPQIANKDDTDHCIYTEIPETIEDCLVLPSDDRVLSAAYGVLDQMKHGKGPLRRYVNGNCNLYTD